MESNLNTKNVCPYSLIRVLVESGRLDDHIINGYRGIILS